MCIYIYIICTITFFFFFRNRPKRGGTRQIHYGRSAKYTDSASRGSSSIQTWSGGNLQADLAKQCATLLACLQEWQKDTPWKAGVRSLMSSKMWSKLEESLPPFERAFIIIFESPSSSTWFRQSSFTKTRALRAANTSTISTDVGSGIICVKAAMIRPLSLRITPPSPANFRSLKVAPSKLIFNQPDGGGV